MWQATVRHDEQVFLIARLRRRDSGVPDIAVVAVGGLFGADTFRHFEPRPVRMSTLMAYFFSNACLID